MKNAAGNPITMNTWVGFTLSGLVGFLAAVVTITMSYSDVAHTAAAAETRTEKNAVDIDAARARLLVLERQQSAAEEWRRSTRKQLDRIEAALVK